jgi:DUF2938 family protein
MFDAILIGAGATGFLDLWSAARARFFGAPAPDYSLVGRWLAHLMRGRLVHDAIATSAPVKGERLIGWAAHYLIGIAFAAVLLIGWGTAWAREPTLFPALIVGIGSVAAPFLLMQPSMGLGIAARRTPDPAAARRRSLTTHAIFGLGLYAAGWAVRLIEL